MWFRGDQVAEVEQIWKSWFDATTWSQALQCIVSLMLWWTDGYKEISTGLPCNSLISQLLENSQLMDVFDECTGSIKMKSTTNNICHLNHRKQTLKKEKLSTKTILLITISIVFILHTRLKCFKPFLFFSKKSLQLWNKFDKLLLNNFLIWPWIKPVYF